MKVLITGAFGNIGRFLIPELVKQKYSVNCLVLPNEKNKKIIQGTKVFYGDVRKKKDFAKAIEGCDVVIHLAFIDPDVCKERPLFAYKVNIGGTRNLIQVAERSCRNIKIVFSSSASVYFYELNKNSKKIKSLRYNKYTKHKLECEKLIKLSLLSWSILRIGPILPIEFPIPGGLLNIPANTRFEFIHINDVVTALINASKRKKANRKVLLIGGGKEFRMQYKDFVKDLFSIVDFKVPSDSDFSFEPYLTNYFDTKESQEILDYQKHHYEDFLKEMRYRAKNINRF